MIKKIIPFCVLIVFGSCQNSLKTIEVKKLEFRPIYFEHGSDEINPKYFPLLDSIANYIIKNPKVSYEIIGSCHQTEPDSKNNLNNLAVRRAKAVINYIEEKFEIKVNGYTIKFFGSSLGSTEKYIPPPAKEQRIVIFEIND